MRSKRWLLLGILGMLIPYISIAQFNDTYLRLGASVGAMNYLGDLAPSNPYEQSHPGFGLYASYKLSPMLSVRGTATFGRISGSDADSDDPELRARNLSFRSNIQDFSLQLVGDFFFTPRGYVSRPFLTPYVFIGLSLMRINPEAEVNGQWVELQPLGTEGQFLRDSDVDYPDPYRLTQLTIPLGAGLRFRILRDLDIEFELSLRMTFTDYLDDVSGYYPNLRDLNRKNPTAARLSDRSNPGDFPDGRVDKPRGDRSQDDWLMYSSVSISYILSWVRCPQNKR